MSLTLVSEITRMQTFHSSRSLSDVPGHHADVDQDGDVDTDDLNALHDELGIELTDVNNNGCVDIDDLLLVIEDWNAGCTP